MPKKGFCRICQFFHKPYRQSEKETFEKLVREGTSLRRLEVFFQALNLKVRKDAISNHIKKCLNLEISEQRRIEKELAKGRGLSGVGRKLGGFFIRPKEDPILATECPHAYTENFFDLKSERVLTRCKKCGEILSGNFDPHKEKTKRKNNLLLWESLRHE